MTLGFIPNLGFTELILILIIALVIFGPSKLPEVGKALGKSIREFKSATSKTDEDSTNNSEEKKEQS